MQFSKELPAKKKKHYPNLVTDDPAFQQLLKVLDEGLSSRASVTLTPEDIQRFAREKPPIKFPWRVAADTLRKRIEEKKLNYRAFKYQTGEGGWAVGIIQKIETKAQRARKKRTEEGRLARSA